MKKSTVFAFMVDFEMVSEVHYSENFMCKPVAAGVRDNFGNDSRPTHRKNNDFTTKVMYQYYYFFIL